MVYWNKPSKMYAVVIPDGGAHTLSALVYLFFYCALLGSEGGKEWAGLVTGFFCNFTLNWSRQTNVTGRECQRRVTGRIIATCGSAFRCHTCAFVCSGGVIEAEGVKLCLHAH